MDYEITAAQLIRDGHLRPVDLYRRSADVELVNLSQAQRIVSNIADLDESGAGRAAIRELPNDAAWRDSFVGAILDCLERRHRDLGNGPAKALIVARSQPDARAFQETANRLMRERGLRPIAELAVSDEPDAHETLEKFRRLDRPGVLCTVDMAGEVHGTLARRNVVALGIPSGTSPLALQLSLAGLHQAGAACHSVVRAYNRFVYRTTVERWLADGLMCGNWSVDRDSFQPLFDLFVSLRDMAGPKRAYDAYRGLPLQR